MKRSMSGLDTYEEGFDKKVKISQNKAHDIAQNLRYLETFL